MTLETKHQKFVHKRHPKSIHPSIQYLLAFAVEFFEIRQLYYLDRQKNDTPLLNFIL